MEQKFFEWLVENKSDLLIVEFRPLLINLLTEKIYDEYIKDTSKQAIIKYLKTGEEEGIVNKIPIEQWDIKKLISKFKVEELEYVFNKCKHLSLIKDSLISEYLEADSKPIKGESISSLKDRCLKLLNKNLCPLCRNKGDGYVLVKPFSTYDRKYRSDELVQGRFVKCPLCSTISPNEFIKGDMEDYIKNNLQC